MYSAFSTVNQNAQSTGHLLLPLPSGNHHSHFTSSNIILIGLTFTQFMLCVWLKMLVPIHGSSPLFFFKHMEILVPEVESYLEVDRKFWQWFLSFGMVSLSELHPLLYCGQNGITLNSFIWAFNAISAFNGVLCKKLT